MRKPSPQPLAIKLTKTQLERLDRRAALAGTTRLEMLLRILRGQLTKTPSWITIH